MTIPLAALNPTVQWYLTLMVFSVALFLGVVLVHRVVRDLKGEGETSSVDPDDLLAPLAEAFADGQMSREEYDRIRESLRRAERSALAPDLPVKPKVAPRGNGTTLDADRSANPSPATGEGHPPEGS